MIFKERLENIWTPIKKVELAIPTKLNDFTIWLLKTILNGGCFKFATFMGIIGKMCEHLILVERVISSDFFVSNLSPS